MSLGGTSPVATILGPVLRSKVQIPPRSVVAIDRPRVHAAIDAGLADSGPVVVVAGPGFAKTTTVAEWARRRPTDRVAWLTVDARDNAPARLVLGVVEAIRQIEPGFGDEVVAALMFGPDTVLDHAGPLLLEEIERLPAPIVFVLDGADKLEDGKVRRLLGWLLRRPPANVSIVVTSQSETAVDLAMLQADSDVTVLDESDLAFDRDDIDEMHRVLRAGEPTDEVRDALLAETEGWPVGVILALRSTAPGTRFSSSDHIVRTFLLRAVLDPLDPDDARAFLTVHLFDRTCDELCAALLDGERPREVLSRLRDRHLLPPIESGESWFAPFSMWQEFAADEYERRFPGELETTLSRAAEWTEVHGAPEEAVSLWLRTGALARAASVVLRWHLLWSSTGRGDEVLGWCEHLRSTTPDTPELLLVEAWAHVLGHSVAGAEAALAALTYLRVSDAERQTLIECEAVAIQVSIARRTGHLEETQTLARAAADRVAALGPVTWQYRGRTPNDTAEDLAVTMLYAGDVAGAQRRLLELLPTARNSVMALLVASHLAVANWLLQEPDLGECELLRRRLDALRVPTFVDGVGHAMVALVAPTETVEPHRRRLATIAAAVPEPALRVLRCLVDARLAAAADDLDQTAVHLAAARAEIDACPGPGVLPALVERLVQLLGVDPPVGTVDITEAELRVLRALAGPLTEREIARELGLAHNTVRSHRRRIYRKFDVEGRAEAVAAARAQGIL